jgi:toxin-antitoxin system PIN domain toxin
MSSLSFPDINVWLALILADHQHREAAVAWWDADQSDQIAFSRLTQIGVLRLLTTPAAMNGKPLTMGEAWKVYDGLLSDDRVVLLPEPLSIDAQFRRAASSDRASPKVWADAYVAAFAEAAVAEVITFDRALAARCRNSRLLSTAVG